MVNLKSTKSIEICGILSERISLKDDLSIYTGLKMLVYNLREQCLLRKNVMSTFLLAVCVINKKTTHSSKCFDFL